MNAIADLSIEQWQDWLNEAKIIAQKGENPDYIPRLVDADPTSLAIAVATPAQLLSLGDSQRSFVLMSVIKSFLLLYLLSHWGADWVFQRVGRKPSAESFNSLDQLETDGGFPRNPMINSGAIALSGLLPGETPDDACNHLRLWLNRIAPGDWRLDRLMLASVESLPNARNRAIANTLTKAGYLEQPERALAIYNRICCLSGNVVDLAQLGRSLVYPPLALETSHCQIVQDLMTTCGLYEASARFAQTVGLPTKSGVSGGILALIPSENCSQAAAIAIYSPPLNGQGNSVAGLWLISQLVNFLRKH